MTMILIEILWTVLLTTALFFIVIELTTRLAPSILYFGVTLLLLCCFVGIDIWVIPRVPVTRHLYWFKVQHVFASFVVPMLLHYLLVLLDSSHRRLLQALFFGSALLAVLFMSPLMLRQRADGVVVGTTWYLAIFLPYFALSVLLVHAYLIAHWRASSRRQRRVVKFHFLGFAFLSICGLIDIVMLFDFLPRAPVHGYLIVGTLGFGTLNSAVFLEHFAYLVGDYKNTYHKLESAYRDLEEANALKEVGMSSAMIAHEIKNYLFVVGAHAKLLARSTGLSTTDRKRVASIETAVGKMGDFSRGILELARSRQISDKRLLDLEQLIRTCIARHEAFRHDLFEISATGPPPLVQGNWGRLEQAFVNIFLNAVEAGGTRIAIRLICRRCTVLVSIQDNGAGCAPEKAASLFNAFYTTKEGSKGTGLGLSIVRAIVESHGGHVSCYGRNDDGEGHHGLTLNVTFPVVGDEEALPENDTDVVVVKGGMDDYPQVLRVLRNVRIQPRTVESVSDAARATRGTGAVVLASATAASELTESDTHSGWYAVVSDPVNGLRIMSSNPASPPERFSEEYVLTRLQA